MGIEQKDQNFDNISINVLSHDGYGSDDDDVGGGNSDDDDCMIVYDPAIP